MAMRATDIETWRPIDTSGAVDIDRDRHLVVLHQQGDAAAFDELYRRYHGRLVAYCARRVGDRHAAEELAQEAFVRALRAMPRFAGERRFYPWMTVIAARLCIDHHRKVGRVEPVAELDAGSVDADHDALWAAVDREHLATALDHLAPRHREVLELREERGWSYQQIAEHLGVPMTTVEALLHRARKSLRRQFQAAASGDRVGALGVVAVGGAMAKAQRWIGAGAGKLGPALGGAAVAGSVAVGIVAAPCGGGAGPATTVEVAPVASAVPAASTTTLAAAGPAAEPIAPAGPAVVVPAPAAPTAPSPPPPAADLGLAEVHVGGDAAGWARGDNADQPLRIDVAGVVDIGFDPGQLLDDVLTPGTGGHP